MQRKKVDNAKVAGNGAESQEHGPLFVEQEYKQGIRIIEANGNYEERLYKSDILQLHLLHVQLNKLFTEKKRGRD